MAETTEQFSLAEFFRLKACPGCGYSFETLAPTGRCPECGRSYDQTIAVLPGVGSDDFNNVDAGNWRKTIGRLVWIVIMLWAFAFSWRSAWNPNIIAWGVIGVVATALWAYAQLFSARRPELQLWINAYGVAQSLSTADARAMQWMQRNLVSLLLLPLFFTVAVLADVRSRGVIMYSMAIAVWLIAIAIGIIRYRRREDFDTDNYTPKLWSWTAIDKLRVDCSKRGRVHVRCRTMRYWRRIPISAIWVVDLQIKCDPSFAESVREQFVKWWSDARAFHGLKPLLA